jgi:hypothetical protein
MTCTGCGKASRDACGAPLVAKKAEPAAPRNVVFADLAGSTVVMPSLACAPGPPTPLLPRRRWV